MKRDRVKPKYHFPVAPVVQLQPAREERDSHIDVVTVSKDGKFRVVHVFFRRINVARPLCDALLGERHSARYRMGAGVIVMAFGVTIAKVFGHVAMPAVAFCADAVGYGIHALGMVPFIEHLMDRYKASQKE